MKCRAREEVDVPHAGKERGKDAGGFHRLRAEVSVWRRKMSRLIVTLLTLISHQSCSNLSCAQRTSGEAEGEEWGSKQGRRGKYLVLTRGGEYLVLARVKR